MKAKSSVRQASQQESRAGRISAKTRGGGSADAKAAAANSKITTREKSSEKMKGGGYGDARGATAERKRNAKGSSAENIRKPF
jgi:hypothetical protein